MLQENRGDQIATVPGQRETGVVKDGKLVLNDGHKFSTPSAAAVHVTKSIKRLALLDVQAARQLAVRAH